MHLQEIELLYTYLYNSCSSKNNKKKKPLVGEHTKGQTI